MEVCGLKFDRSQAGVAVPGFLLIGSGIGMLVDNVAAGGTIGLGAGLLTLALVGGKKA